MDEADKLVESTFYTPVKSIADMLPQSKQVLAMSATYDQVRGSLEGRRGGPSVVSSMFYLISE